MIWMGLQEFLMVRGLMLKSVKKCVPVIPRLGIIGTQLLNIIKSVSLNVGLIVVKCLLMVMFLIKVSTSGSVLVQIL